MASEEEKSNDFYSVLGLEKECTTTELRNAYKKLALRWHPDRCSASGNSKFVDEAKKKFQDIQEAYSVLSDENKRFLYDVGVYDCDDDENGMGEFLNEMAAMMNQNKSNENREESFEELQELFEEMFQSDIEALCSSSSQVRTCEESSSSSFLFASGSENHSITNKRNCSEMSSGKTRGSEDDGFNASLEGFCFGAGEHPRSCRREKEGGGGGIRAGRGGTTTSSSWSSSPRRDGRKQKLSSGHDVSSSTSNHHHHYYYC